MAFTAVDPTLFLVEKSSSITTFLNNGPRHLVVGVSALNEVGCHFRSGTARAYVAAVLTYSDLNFQSSHSNVKQFSGALNHICSVTIAQSALFPLDGEAQISGFGSLPKIAYGASPTGNVSSGPGRAPESHL